MKKISLLFSLFSFFITFSQGGFQLANGIKKVTIPFQLVNNLIVVPVTLNGVSLNFLLDTGVENTILFSLEDSESVTFKNVEKIKFAGLGNGPPIEALKTNKNQIEINDFVDNNHEIYIITNEEVNFSSQLGIPIHGIIGYHFFKNNVIEINYQSKKISVYEHNYNIKLKKFKKFSVFSIMLEQNKPYLLLQSKIEKHQIVDVKLLVDSGNSDAIWLFESDLLKAPSSYFQDFLGRGFSGDIYGKRSRISEIVIGDFSLLLPTASFPDKDSLEGVDLKLGRNGSIGAEILKRFRVVYDYKNNKMYLKKNNLFNVPFNYNMSGMDIEHSGLQYVEEKVELATRSRATSQLVDVTNESPSKFRYQFVLKPVYRVANIRTNSPAAIAGIQKGDIIKKINNMIAYRYKLQDIFNLFQSEEGEWIYVEYERKGIVYKTKFQLQKIL